MPRSKTFEIDWALDKALELFWERGYDGTSMQAIGDHLKLSRSAIYNTFGSKSALFEQALRRAAGKRRTPGVSELENASMPRAALLRAFELAAAGSREDWRPLATIISAAVLLTERVPGVAQVVDETFQELEARFRDAVERGQAAAEIDAAVNPVRVARVLLALYLGMHVHIGSGVARAPVQRALRQQVETLLPAPTPSADGGLGGQAGSFGRRYPLSELVDEWTGGLGQDQVDGS